MEHKRRSLVSYRFEAFVLTVCGIFLLIANGCGTGGVVNSTGGTDADQAAVLRVLELEPFFTESLTNTDEDQESAEAADVQFYSGAQPLESLAAEGSTVDLPLLWWRGQLERLSREVDIHIEDKTAAVTVVTDIAGTFFIVDDVGDVLVLGGKSLEDQITRSARFEKMPAGWVLTAISPVKLNASPPSQQTVFIESLRAYIGSDLIWEATDPATLYSVPENLPTFSQGDEVRVEAEVVNTSTAGWYPHEFVFLHRPGPGIMGRRTRDIMFDDGTNGDELASDGVYTRVYMISPCSGRHFAAVDVIDSGTFADLETPYNSAALGMPYIVQ
jgi:hypothetical protein